MSYLELKWSSGLIRVRPAVMLKWPMLKGGMLVMTTQLREQLEHV